MASNDIAIILGAGASADLGFPLGDALRTNILDGLKPLVGPPRYRGLVTPYSAQNATAFSEKPYETLLIYMNSPLAKGILGFDHETDASPQKIKEFFLDFQKTTHDSIDRFLRDNPQHLIIGKIFLAMEVLLQMYDRQDSQDYHVRNFAVRNAQRRKRNWYQLLINHMRELHFNSPKGGTPKVTFVTFNYEHSLELALEQGLSDTLRHKSGDIAGMWEVLHVNGSPNDVPLSITDAGNYILETAANFHLVEEEPESSLSAIRKTAREAIAQAQSTYVIGFHFDRPNSRTIGLDTLDRPESVFCLNFDGNKGVAQRMKELGVLTENVSSGTQEQCLGSGLIKSNI